MPTIDFILIGAMKSGTTTLINYLRKHPEIYIPKVKEPQFFSRDNKYSKGIAWYEALFADAKPQQLCGEGSTCYSRWPKYPDAAERIFKYAPDIKLIYIVREPVERTYSHFRHSFLKGEMNYEVFRQALDDEVELIESSKYMMQINHYLKYFDKAQFMFIKFEDLVIPNKETFRQLFQFLSISEVDLIGQAPISSNKAGFGRTNKSIVRFIQLAKYIPGLSYLVKSKLSPASRREILHSMAGKIIKSNLGAYLIKSRINQIPEMLPEDRHFIFKTCEKDLKEFEAFSKLDLCSWYKLS